MTTDLAVLSADGSELDTTRSETQFDETQLDGTRLDETGLDAAPVDGGAVASRGSGRLLGIDIARAMALMGMFTQHISIDTAAGETSTGWVGRVFIESAGRASVLFFVLSGVSLAIIHSRGSASASDGALRRRGFLLLAGGLLLTSMLWPASILQHYGLAFLLAPWLLRLGRRGLAAVTALGLVGGPVLLLFAKNWTDEVTGLWTGRAGGTLIETSWDILVSGTYPMVLWIGFFTFGMLVGRLNLWNRMTLVRLLVVAAVATVGFGLLAAELGQRYGQAGFPADGSSFEADDFGLGSPDSDGKFEDIEDGKFEGFENFEDFKKDFPEEPADWRALYDVMGHSGRIGWTMQTGALAVAIMSLALLMPAAVTGVLKPLAWMGSMSLTAYLVHIVLVTDVFERFVDSSDLSVIDQEWVLLGLIGVMIGLCSIFYLLMKVGPLEWLLKQFTVWPARPGSSA